MRVGAPRETAPRETRVAMTPSSARHLARLGHECLVESGAGAAAGFTDEAYREAGVEVVADAAGLWRRAGIVAKVRPPSEGEMRMLGEGATLVCFFFPSQNPGLLEIARERGATVVAMDMVPRISRAQKMDALSSMGSIAGYRAVIEACGVFGRFLGGQVTAAGKAPPARVLVLGAGVAGLAAIGTAHSLGATVRAFDVRPEVGEQVESMGAEFLYLDFEEDGSGSGGYAAPSSPEFRARQLERFRAEAPETDIVITTAQIPGRDAPRLWLADMVAAMRPGSVVVDLAAERGGNCELTVADEQVVTDNGVTVVGHTDLATRMATHASEFYSTNVRHLVAELTPGRDGRAVHDMGDDVIRGATVAHGGEVTYPPPPPKAAEAAAPARPPPTARARTPEEQAGEEAAAARRAARRQVALLAAGGLAALAAGQWAPPSFVQHLTVFVLAVFVGFQVVWNVTHALHTPLISVTNAISGIIVVGALLQVGDPSGIVGALAAVAVLISTVNIVGGFMVTRRMLRMFRKS